MVFLYVSMCFSVRMTHNNANRAYLHFYTLFYKMQKIPMFMVEKLIN